MNRQRTKRAISVALLHGIRSLSMLLPRLYTEGPTEGCGVWEAVS